MRFYQANILRVGERYLLTHVTDVGNPLRIRVDHMRAHRQRGDIHRGKGRIAVMRLAVAPVDAMRAWEYVNPRELLNRYSAHCAQERARIAAALSGTASGRVRT